MPTRDFALALHLTDANGTARGRIAGAKNVRIHWPTMDQAVVTFDYPDSGPLAARLAQPCDIRTYFSPTGTDNWQLQGPKFLRLGTDGDRVLNTNGLRTHTCVSWDFILTKAKVHQYGLTGGLNTGIWDPATGPRVFNQVTAGFIIETLTAEKSTRSGAAWSYFSGGAGVGVVDVSRCGSTRGCRPRRR